MMPYVPRRTFLLRRSFAVIRTSPAIVALRLGFGSIAGKLDLNIAFNEKRSFLEPSTMFTIASEGVDLRFQAE